MLFSRTSSVCNLCNQEIEDLQHLFIKCPELRNIYDYIVMKVDLLLQHCDFLNNLNVDEVLLLGFPWNKKRVNGFF